MQINWKWLRRRSIHAGFAGVCLGTVAVLSPAYDLVQLLHYSLPLVILALGVSHAFSALVRPDEWLPSELQLIRELAAAGFVVLPDVDGGYTVYASDGQTHWHDHWRDVEDWAKGEVQLCSAN